MSDEMAELKKRLKEAFEVATKLYLERGFQRRIGFGRKPALANVDFQISRGCCVKKFIPENLGPD